MAVVGTVTSQMDNNTRHWRVTFSGVTTGNTSPVFSGKGYQVGTAIVVQTGTPGAQWQGSNDGVNFVNVGTSITTTPVAVMLASPDNGVYAVYQLSVTGAGATASGTVDFVSQNAS